MVCYPLVERSTTGSRAMCEYNGIVTREVALKKAAMTTKQLDAKKLDYVVYNSTETSPLRAVLHSRGSCQNISVDSSRFPNHDFIFMKEALFLGGANKYENLIISTLPGKRSALFVACWSQGAHGVMKLRTRKHRIYTGGQANLCVRSRENITLLSDKMYSSIDSIKDDELISHLVHMK